VVGGLLARLGERQRSGRMPSVVEHVIKFRLDIDEEFQGWILMFASMTVVFLFCLPCYCAGLSYPWARALAARCRQSMPTFFVVMALINGTAMFLIITWLPDWGYSDYIKAVARFAAWFITHLLKGLSSIIIIVAAIFVIAFKDRILLLLGLDHHQLFKFKLRDCMSCFGQTRFRPVDLSILKVEDLAAGDIFSANNVFIEVHLGYNEPQCTRVHINAGSSCMIKESLQLNYDEEDEDDHMQIFIKNQKMVGAGGLARLELTADQVKDLESASRKKGSDPNMRWEENAFEPMRLYPHGTIWLRVTPVDEEDVTQTC
jgi:hypothetical protein